MVCHSLCSANLNAVFDHRGACGGGPQNYAIINLQSSFFLAGRGRWFCFRAALPQPLLLVANRGWFEGREADLTHTTSSPSQYRHPNSVPCGPMAVTSVVASSGTFPKPPELPSGALLPLEVPVGMAGTQKLGPACPPCPRHGHFGAFHPLLCFGEGFVHVLLPFPILVVQRRRANSRLLG